MKQKKRQKKIKKITTYFLAVMLTVVFYNQFFVTSPTDTIGDAPQLGYGTNPANKPQEGIAKQKQEESESNIQTLSTKKVVWGVGKNRNALNQPSDVLQLQETYGKYDAYFLAPTEEEKKIYLTFDAGFENGNVQKVVDTLKEKNIKATFFLVSDMFDTHPELIQQILDDGHTIGNHTWSHLSAPDVGLEKAKEDTTKLHEYVKENWNYEMNLFRFPKGEFSEQTLAQNQAQGYKTLFWSFAYQDWDDDNQMDPAKALALVKEGLHPGAIYLLHPTSATNAEILGDFIAYCIEQGYEISTF